MTKTQALVILRGALATLMGASTFRAYAGESCRQCPRARDGGCTEPHDLDCAYWMAYHSAEQALEQTRQLVTQGER